MIDVLIVGGSIAGLSAALLLGRCCRDVVICDAGRPRNRFSRHMHGFLSQEGIPPKKFLQICRNQIAEFQNVQFYSGEIISLQRSEGVFRAETDNGTRFDARSVLWLPVSPMNYRNFPEFKIYME